MPIYEYRCEACGHQLEAMQKMTDAPLRECPVCAEPRLKRLISAAGFRLKGGGWYETDFKTGDKKKNVVKSDTAAPASGKGDSAAPASGKGEAAPGKSGKSEAAAG